MPYYAPFYQPYTSYTPNTQNAFIGQNNANYGYSNAYPNTQQQNQAIQQSDTTMLWVLNKNEADGYPVAPNCSVVLWDKNSPTIYVKSMSSNGVPSMRILDFVERSEMPQKPPATAFNIEGNNFVTQDEMTAINGKINDLTARCDSLERLQNDTSEEKQKTTTKKTKGGDE